MIIVTDPSDLPRIANLAIRELVALRMEQLHSPDDELDGEPIALIVVEAGDSVLAIENAAGLPFLSAGLFDDLPFDHPDYVPPTEFIERHNHDNAIIFELFFTASDSGAGTALFVSDEENGQADLLAMCRSWATPACCPAVSTP